MEKLPLSPRIRDLQGDEATSRQGTTDKRTSIRALIRQQPELQQPASCGQLPKIKPIKSCNNYGYRYNQLAVAHFFAEITME